MGQGAESGEQRLLFVPVFLPGMRMQCSEAEQLPCEHEDKGCLGCSKDFGSKLAFECLVPEKNKIPNMYKTRILFLSLAVRKTILTDTCDK